MSKVMSFRFGLLAPTENADVIADQMRLAHRYRNVLVEIERGRRSALRSIESAAGDVPALEEAKRIADEEFRAADEAVARERARTRKRTETPEMTARLVAAREARSLARRAVGAAKAILRGAELREDFARVEEIAKGLVRNARAHCGLARLGPYSGAFGTYQLVESASEQSFNDTGLYDFGEPCDPQFSRERDRKRFRIGVQLQRDAAIEKIVGGESGSVRVGAIDESAWHDRSPAEHRPRGEGKRSKMRTTLRLRLGTRVDTGETLYGEWPMIMHREIPAGSVVKRVDVTKERIGARREQWYAVFTVDVSGADSRAKCGEGRIAVNFGWRLLAEGALRVGVGVDAGLNAVEHVALDAEWIGYARKVEDLSSIRKKNFNEARSVISGWLKAQGDSAPEWIRIEARTLDEWKSAGRLYSLARRWRDARFDGDEGAYVALEKWRYHEHHLEEWESAQRAKAQRKRKEAYRATAARLSATYAELVITKTARADFARKPKREADYVNETASANRQLASTYELESALRWAFTRNGGSVVVVDGANATHTCADCDTVNDFDAAGVLSVTCVGCGRSWDHDANMARNLMRRCERERGPWKPGGSRSVEDASDSAKVGGGKWAKRKMKKAAKASGDGAAREVGSEAAE